MHVSDFQASPQYEVFAVRYASMDRARRDNFISGDPHDSSMPMDFFIWLLRSPERVILVDTGFNAQMAQERDRQLLHCPIDMLHDLDLNPKEITDVILTHLHYDHAGNLDKLPQARFHIQDDELDYATGRYMCFDQMRHAYAVEDVVSLVRHVYQKRVVFYDGDAEIAPGVNVIKIGGHTKGLQAVSVMTSRGKVVLASDASHYYENMNEHRPFPIVYNVADMLNGYERLDKHAESSQHVIPGHDPLVMLHYPKYQENSNIVMLHKAPLI